MNRPALDQLKRRRRLSGSSPALLLLAAVILPAFLIVGPASASWFIDPARRHISAHGQMGCLDCHDRVAKADPHPDPANVTRSFREIFEVDHCAVCHDQVMEDLEEGRHGARENVDQERYERCILCHDPHYGLRRGENKIGDFKPGVPKEKQCGACHEERKSLPEPDDQVRGCLKCHQPPAEPGARRTEEIGLLCGRCHRPGQGGADNTAPRIDPAAYAKTAHAGTDCLACHPQAAAFDHDLQRPGDCLQCHHRHDEGKAHDAHLIVSCQACHLGQVQPLRDELTREVVWEVERIAGKPSSVHQLSDLSGEKGCRRCHAPGNHLGAAAAVLPAKSVICMPCHPATFSVGDTTTLLALAVFLVGLILAASVWLTGTLAGRTTLGAKLGYLVGRTLKTIFSARLIPALKGFLLDGLLQRGLLKQSPGRWFIHGLIFWPFVFRFGWGFLALLVSLLLPRAGFVWPMLNKNFWLTAALFDLSGVLVILGVLLALGRRLLEKASPRPAGLPGQDRLALALLGGIIVIGFILEGMRMSMTGYPPGSRFAIAGLWVSHLFKGADGLTEIYGYVWYLHAVLTGAFLAYLPFSRMFHIILAPLLAAAKAAWEAEGHRPPENPTRKEP